MTWFIFIGDLVVMAALFGVAAYLFLRANPADLAAAARIPLDDDSESHPPTAAHHCNQGDRRRPASSPSRRNSGDGAGTPHA